MKKSIIGVILFISSSLLTLNSCKKTVSNVTSTTLNVIQNDPAATIFSAIETRAADDAVINSSSTILIPVDTAFMSAGVSINSVANLSVATCDSIVKYYTMSGAINFNGNATAEVSFLSNLGSPFFADSTSATTYFNGIPALSQTPAVTGNTSIYKLSQYLSLPVGSVSQITAADTSLSLFNEAFNRTNFAATIANGSFTLFMPTNNAFINAGYADIASIDAANLNVLTQILMYNTIPNDFFDNDLPNQTALTSLQGESIQLNTSNGSLQLMGNSDPSMPANLLNNGILVGNNVLAYKTSSVLLP